MSFLFKKKDTGSGNTTPVKDEPYADSSSSSSHSAATQQRTAVLAASSAPPSPALRSSSDMVYSPQQPLRQPILSDPSIVSTASHSTGSTPMSTSPISSPTSLHNSMHAAHSQQPPQQQHSAYYQQVPTLHAAALPTSMQLLQQQQHQPIHAQSQHVQAIPGFSPHSAHTNLVPVSAQAVLATPATLSASHQTATPAMAIPIASSSGISSAFPPPSQSSAPSSSFVSASPMATSQPSSPLSSTRESPSSSIDGMQSMAVFEEKQSEDTLILRAHFAHLTPLTRQLFHVGDTLGTGTFGRVRLVSYLQPSLSPKPLHFALKMLKKSEIIRLKQVEHIKAEKSILSRICHPFIVNLFAHFQDERYLYMCMEYVIGGELFSQLRKVGRFSNDTARFYAAEIVLALQYLHAKDIVYRDLKPENLLIDREGHIKITDFGFAKVVEDRTWTLCGTPEYLAPEIIQSKGHGKAVDWWALGILIYEMISGYPPFYDENPFGIYQKILAGRIDFPRHFDPYAKDLVKKLLTADRSKRFGCLRDGADDVKRHRWFKGVDWARVYNRRVKPPYVPGFASSDDTCFPQADHDVLTDAGFMGYAEFRRAKEEGRAVHVACPVLSSGAEASDGQYGIEWRPIDKVRLISSASQSLVHFHSRANENAAQAECNTVAEDSERCEESGNVDLLVTSNHRMLVASAPLSDATKRRWPSPRALPSAQQVYDEPNCAVSFLCYASHGAAPVSPLHWSSLPCSTALNLPSEDAVHATLELYGYFLGCGIVLRFPSVILLPTRTAADVACLESLLQRLGVEQLPAGRRGGRCGYKRMECRSSGESDRCTQFRMYHPSWYTFFASQGSEDEECQSADERAVDEQLTADTSDQRMRRWVLQHLDARGCRLVLRGLQRAAGERVVEVELCTRGSILTYSARMRDDVERLILHAGLTASTTRKLQSARSSGQKDAWRLSFLERQQPDAHPNLANNRHTCSRPAPTSRSQQSPQQLHRLLSPLPVPVWCISVPTAEQLIVVRRRLRSGLTSRPTLVGNSNFDKYPDSDTDEAGAQLGAKEKEQFVDF